ncbi:MAG: response regulator [Nitrospinae bacterium]|nr:response regulator [Nitrospinota bacterium]
MNREDQIAENRSLRILVVEDDEDDVFIIKDLIHEGLTGNSPVVDHTPSSAEALDRLNKSLYDLCLFDYRLGEVDGIHLLSLVRARGIEVPIIFLTGHGDQEIAVEAMKAGANDYLSKGKLSAEALSHSIRYAMQLHKEAEARKQAEEKLKRSHAEVTRKNAELQESLQKLREAQNQILRSEKLAGIGRLAAGVCHEILNPLNIISGHVQALQMERGDDASLKEDLVSIMEEIDRIEKIIGGLLKFSRKGDVELRYTDINRELESVLSLVEKDLLLNDIRVVRRFDLNMDKVLIDTDRMRQVFLNLINNAKYAMQASGGTLTLTTRTVHKDRRKSRRDDTSVDETVGIPFARIVFSDTGTGIKKEHMDKLFDPFFTTKPEDKGTGLGLSVCYTIIEKHAGALEVESEYGHGATFTIDLPFNPPGEVGQRAVESNEFDSDGE